MGNTPTSVDGSTPTSVVGNTPTSVVGNTPTSVTNSTPISLVGSTPAYLISGTPVSDTSTPDHVVPPALRNIKSPVYAPMLLSLSMHIENVEQNELPEENDVIDLTRIDDVDSEQLQTQVEFLIKKEELNEEVILNQEQFPVANIDGPL